MKDLLKQAIELSKESVAAGGYPAGALVVRNGEIIARGLSDGQQLCDATSHAEISAIREASKKLNKRDLTDVVLYTSLEPCVMCFTASFWAHVPKIVFACSRKAVSPKYYEGEHDISELNKSSIRQIELVHFKELENEALKVITNWEETQLK
ncbi:MAG: nucleoside deaminase [Patescibacteria group bacterium]